MKKCTECDLICSMSKRKHRSSQVPLNPTPFLIANLSWQDELLQDPPFSAVSFQDIEVRSPSYDGAYFLAGGFQEEFKLMAICFRGRRGKQLSQQMVLPSYLCSGSLRLCSELKHCLLSSNRPC